jgi:hypothetical protein
VLDFHEENQASRMLDTRAVDNRFIIWFPIGGETLEFDDRPSQSGRYRSPVVADHTDFFADCMQDDRPHVLHG